MIEELKSHEKRYTIILVLIFILLIVASFLYFLSISNKKLHNNPNITNKYSGITTLYENIYINNKKESYTINIDNDTNNTIKYKVLLLEDTNAKEKCKCDSIFNPNTIKYSTDGTIKSLENNIIAEGRLEKNKDIDINISVWLDNSTDHMHGYFKIIKIDE